MNIFYNYELDDEIDLIKTNPQVETFVNELRAFVTQRLKVLEDEMNKQESKKDCCVVIVLPLNSKEDFTGLLYMGYSDDLKIKLRTCITDDDVSYMHSRLSLILNSLY